MAFTIPTLEQISQALRANIVAELPDSSPFLQPNNLWILVKSLAPLIRSAYIRMAWLYAQAFAGTAETEALERKASDYGIVRLAATYASGSVLATTDIGTFIPAASRLLSPTGAAFDTTLSVTAAQATTSLPVVAEDTGPAGNLGPGTVLSFETPVAGAGATVTVAAAGFTGGSDIESDASLRARLLEKLR